MSTHDLNVKLSVKSSARRTSDEKHTVRDGNEQSLTETSREYLQSKNLYIRRKILLKSIRDQSSTAEDQNETLDQLRFTSFFSLRFPSKRSEKNRTENESETQPSGNNLKPNDVRRPAVVQHPELWGKRLLPNSFSEPITAVNNESESKPLENYPQQNHLGHDTSHDRSTGGIQGGVALCDQAQPAINSSQRQTPSSDHPTELPVTEGTSAVRKSGVNDPLAENAEETLSHSNIIPIGEDNGSKASPNCQPSACSTRALKRALSLPSLPASPHSCKLETESSHIGPSSAMFTSTIVSVLAPHWSGRFRRHKRGASDVEQDSQLSGQNSNLSATSQNAPQQPFPLTQIKPNEEMLGDLNNKIKEPARARYAEWQKDSKSPHFTSTFQTKQTLSSASSLDTNQKTLDSNIESGRSVTLSAGTGQMPRSPLSPGYKRISQPGDQGESFSPPTSRPTTSSLLLSWRRIHSRKANAESTEMEKQLAMSVSSLTLPSKSLLKVSQPHSPLDSPENPTKDTSVPYIYPNSPEGLSSADKSPVSPRRGDMDSSKKTMFLIKGEFDSSSRTSWTKTSKDPQSHSKETLERKYSHIGNSESVEKSNDAYAHLHNSSVNVFHTKPDYPSTSTSPKDNANNNNTENIASHSCYTSDNVNNCVQSNNTYDIINSNKANTTNASSTSKGTVAWCTSQTQMGQNNIQNSIINSSSLCPESPSPKLTNYMSRRTFTSSLIFSPRKEPSAVEGTSPSHVWYNYLNSRQSQSNQSPSGLASPQSSSGSLRRVRVPSIYTYLRETSPPLSTGLSPVFPSFSPQTPSLKQDDHQIQKDNKNAGTSRFTFDLSFVESQDSGLSRDSRTSSAPQSLPPDFGRRSTPRLSKSPYSTLISARPALTRYKLSSPPASYQHSKSASHDSSAILDSPPTAEKASHPSKLEDDCLLQGIAGEAVCSSDKQLVSETGQTSSVSLDTCMSQSSPDTRFTDHQASHLITNATRPKPVDIVIKNIPHKELDGMFLSKGDKSSTSAAPGLNYKKQPSCTFTDSEAVPAVVQEKARGSMFQGVHNTNSKKSFFSKSKKENILTSDPSSVKEGLNRQDIKKGEMTGLKSLNKMDLFNRLKIKFGVKRSEDEDLTTSRKTKNCKQYFSDLKDSENIKKGEKRDNESQTFSSNSQSTIVTGSSHNSSEPLSGFILKNEEHENFPSVDMHKRFADENGNQFLGRPLSPNWPKPHYINRYATMPQTRKTSPSPSLYPSEFALKSAQKDDVLHSYLPSRRNNSSIYKTEDVPHPANVVTSQRQHLMGAHLSASCADLKYGLERKRSVSVSSVVSSRPSGPGRISTGSKQGSVSDITSSDEFVTRSRHSSISSPCDSPGYAVRGPVHNTYKSCTERLQSSDHLWSPVSLESSPYSWEEDPTPPPSPPASPTSRRMSRIPSSSSNSSRISQDSLSPRWSLPSRNYKSNLSVFEESDSDTTTDDEYYLNSDDDCEKETEL